MKIPGFTAEASLNKAGRYSPPIATRSTDATRVVPQAKSCIATSDGGQWCCVEGKHGPICWSVPPKPPPVLTARQRTSSPIIRSM